MTGQWEPPELKLTPQLKAVRVTRGRFEYGPDENPYQNQPALPGLAHGLVRTSVVWIQSPDQTRLTCVVTDKEM